MEPIRVPPSPSLRRWSQERGYSPEIIARWASFYPDVPGLVAAMEKPAPTFLRLNGLRGSPRETQRRLEAKGFRLQDAGVPQVLRVDEAPFSAGATEEYLMGRYYLQDVASALAALALEPRPGERVADLCAAPGGKTVALADLMKNQGAIHAFESEPGRAQSLVSNLQRCGVANTVVFSHAAQRATELDIQYDRVLLDAPCTGEGVIQRDPSRKKGYLGEFEACAREQSDLLSTAYRLLRPGGVLVYSTCTLAPEENELQMERAVSEVGFQATPLPTAVRNVHLGGAPLAPAVAAIPGRTLAPAVAHGRHVLPHLHGAMGFFLARLEKPQ